MKGVSAVIATILMLMITIAMAGVAYMYISGIFTSKTGTVVDIDETATSCSGTTITVFVRNTGTIAFSKALITLSGTNSAGVAMTGGACTAGTLNAGAGSLTCGTTLTGASTGNNRIVVSGPSNTVTGSVYCSG
jgi:flagellin-like protein